VSGDRGTAFQGGTSPQPLNRYHRQILLPQIGEPGQQRLLASHAVLVGCGALGCTIADLLARAGVGTLTIIDRDVVEPTNLQRQSLFDEQDAAAGAPKALAAQRRLALVNSQVKVHALVEDFNPVNAERLCFEASGAAPRPGLLLDGTDNLATRYLLNDLAVKHGLPLVYGGAVGTEGATMTIRPGATPCLRCLFPEQPSPGTLPTCDTAGVLAPVATIIAACQAADALRILLGEGDRIPPTLLRFDIWQGRRTRLDLSTARDPACPCCALRRFDYLDAGEPDAVSMCGRGAVQVLPRPGQGGAARTIDLRALSVRLGAVGAFTFGEHLLRGELPETGESGDPLRLTVFPDGRALIHGTSDRARAWAVYARYIGD
jgi:adenylyltransferase/sulfurtransferase